MTPEEAIRQLDAWCSQSQGSRPLELGSELELTFERVRPFAGEEVVRIETALGWAIPSDYREFLLRLGECRLFIDKYGTGLEFYGPEQIVRTHKELLDLEEEEPILDRFCMAGHASGLGDYFGFFLDREGARNFDVFCHEYPVFEYVPTSDELDSWKDFGGWLVKAVMTRGEEVL